MKSFLFMLAILCGAAAAQDYPNKPIRWIVPFPPGGGADATARIISHKVTENTGKSIVVDYKSGAGGNIGTEVVARSAGVDILPVPYKGTAPMTLAVLSGEVSMVLDSMTGPLPNVRAGKLRALGYMGERRSPQLPDVPTATEAGLPVVYAAWNGMMAPGGTPPEAIAWLHREIVKAVASQEVSEKLSGLGYEPKTSASPQEFASQVAADLDRFGKIIKEAGIRAE